MIISESLLSASLSNSRLLLLLLLLPRSVLPTPRVLAIDEPVVSMEAISASVGNPLEVEEEELPVEIVYEFTLLIKNVMKMIRINLLGASIF